MDNADEVTLLAQTTIQQIDSLIQELDAFHVAYKQRLEILTRLERRELPDPVPGLHDFMVSVKGTRNSIQRLLKSRTASLRDDPAGYDAQSWEERDNRDRSIVLGCGLATHREQWDAIKRTHGLLSFRRRFGGKNGKLGPTIDSVVENGTEWLKVMSLTAKKLGYQMAQEGWHPDDSSDEEDSDASDDDENSGIGIIKSTKQLVQAARLNRCNTRIPRLRLVLPNLAEGQVEAIDKVLDKTRRLGISKKEEGDVEILIDCAGSPFLQKPIPPLEEAFANMFRDTNLDRLTETLNLELTLILSLVSDIAHAQVEPEEWYSRQTFSHIEDEKHAAGIRLQTVYSALRGRRLECTQEVAQEVCNVVGDLGTETTRARTIILFGRDDMGEGFDAPRTHGGHPANGNGNNVSKVTEAERAGLVSRFRQLSNYPVPDDLQLPIQVVGEEEFSHRDYPKLIEAGKLPPVAAGVWAKLDRSYNRSCHLWGWLQGITTVSANNLNTRLIDATVDKVRIWIDSPFLSAPGLSLHRAIMTDTLATAGT